MKKLLMATLAAVVLSVASGTAYACLDYIGTLGDGETMTFISCGSSAGNYIMGCFRDDGCIIATDPELQLDADLWCMMPFSCNHRDEEIPVAPPAL